MRYNLTNYERSAWGGALQKLGGINMFELFSSEELFMDELEFLVCVDNFNVVSYQDNRTLELTIVTLVHEVTHEVLTVMCDYITDRF